MPAPKQPRRPIDYAKNPRIQKDASAVKTISSIADGIADPEKGKIIRQTLRSYLAALDRPLADAARDECNRLLKQAFTIAYGVGTGQIAPKTDEELKRLAGGDGPGNESGERWHR